MDILPIAYSPINNIQNNTIIRIYQPKRLTTVKGMRYIKRI